MAARTRRVSVMLVILVSVSRSSPGSLVSQEEVSGDNGSKLVTDFPIKDCGSLWSCQGYDYSFDAKRNHYMDRNCACDELCPIFGDCCHDAHLIFPRLSGLNSTPGAADPSEENSLNADKPPLKSRTDSDSGFLGNPFSLFGNATGAGNQFPSFGNATGGSESGIWSSFLKYIDTSNITDTPQLRNGEIFRRYNLDKDMFTCTYEKDINLANNISLVSRCPETYDDVEVTQMCGNVTDDDLMTRLPVSGTDSKVIYRNMFCAMCHEEPYVFWTVGVDCKSIRSLPYDPHGTSLADLLEDSQQCSLQFAPPSDVYRWRSCLADVTSRCNDSFPRDTPYERDIVHRCENETVTVQRMIYGYTRVYRNQHCSECNNNPYMFCSLLSSETVVLPPPTDRRETRINLYSFSILLDINTHTGSATVGHRLQTRTVERNESVSCDRGRVFDPFQSSCRPISCGPGRHFIDNTCKKKTQTAVDNNNNNNNNNTLIHNISREQNDTDARNHSFYVPQTADCSGFLIQLNHTEYQLFQNGTLELLGTDTFYNSSQYFMGDERLHLCVDYSQNYTRTVTVEVTNRTYSFSLPEAVISTCGIVVSLVALAVTMFVYLSLRTLRNIPGQNLLSLVCSLFLADLLLLVGPFAEEEFLACAVLAGAMHYFFLASFLWMNVMAVDVWFTFSKAFVKAGDRGKSSKRFLMYSAYAWLTPLVFVLSAAVVQVLKPESMLSPRYGAGMCWLVNKYALLLFFAAPLFLLLSLNIVFFLISARNISRAKKTSARMLGKEEEGRMGIYVKLTVVMGITWVFGFLAALVPDNKVLIYCFVVMNTLQGLFICLSFVLTSKVISLLKDKFCRRRRKFKVTKSASTDMTNISKSLSANRKLSTASSKSHNVMV